MIASEPKFNWKRIISGIVYFCIASVALWIGWDQIFYAQKPEGQYGVYRLLWCVIASFYGFAVLAVRTYDRKKTPFPSYYSYYPFVLIAIAALTHGIFNIFDKTKGPEFYPIAGSASFLLALVIDKLPGAIISWLEHKR